MARFIWPVAHNVSQNFGGNAAYYKQFGQQGHNGIDLAVAAGTPVKAAESGTIAFEGWGQNHAWMGVPAGICVLIDNGDVYTGYAHLDRTTVSKGQRVNKGDVIGYVGATGAATGPHLHFEFLPKSPNFNNGFAGRVNPANFDIGQEGGEEDEMITREQLEVLFRFRMGRTPDQAAINHYVGKYDFSFVDRDLTSSKEHADYVAQAKAGSLDLKKFMPLKIREVIPSVTTGTAGERDGLRRQVEELNKKVAQSGGEFKELAPGKYLVK